MEEKQIVEITLPNNVGKIFISTKTYKKYSKDIIKPKINICLKNIPLMNDLNSDSKIIYYDNCNYEFTNLMLLEETIYQLTFKSNYNFELNEKDIFPTLKNSDFEINPFSPTYLPDNNESLFYTGDLNFRGFVGKTFIDIKKDEDTIFRIPIEVRSKKIDYMTQYPAMIADLSEFASGLIYESKAPLHQTFELSYNNKKTHYEDFMLLEYLFRPENLPSTFEYLSKNLYSRLEGYSEIVPTSLARNMGHKVLVDIVSSPKNLIQSDNENLIMYKKLNGYLPSKINQVNYKDNIDTPENRFFKYFIEMVDYIIDDCLNNIADGYVKDELTSFSKETSYYLSQKYFNDISPMDYAPFNSQVLQKKEGYRDILHYFLMLEFSYKLNWNEVIDNFEGYEKKLSDLYEYWCYFKLIKILKTLTNTKINYEDIYEINQNGWSIKLHENTKSVLHFDYKNVEIELLYVEKFNKTSKDKSYSLPFKPDYTIRFKCNDDKYLVHFDAKYRVKSRYYDDNYIDDDKLNIYKNPDIYKMHTYRDAIKNTIGAYIFYPGDKEKIFPEKGKEKYQVFPSVGAFPLNPGKSENNENTVFNFLKNLLEQIINNEIFI